MADTIHKKKKDWPHFDKLHLGSKEYAEGWDRIFGKKKSKKRKVEPDEIKPARAYKRHGRRKSGE